MKTFFNFINESSSARVYRLAESTLGKRQNYRGNGTYMYFYDDETEFDGVYPESEWILPDGSKDNEHAFVFSDNGGYGYIVEKSKISREKFKDIFNKFADTANGEVFIKAGFKRARFLTNKTEIY